MIEAYDLSFNLTTYVEPILTAGLECSQNFSFLRTPQIPSGANMTDLNKKYSRYDGTEVVRRVLRPSKSSKYMFKNSEVCRNRGNCW